MRECWLAVAPDRPYILWVFTEEPERAPSGGWRTKQKQTGTYGQLPAVWFPEVTLANSPRKVRIDLMTELE